ncbi:MAG: ATP-dependent helicase [Candidatus Woesearchaeota archaeon]
MIIFKKNPDSSEDIMSSLNPYIRRWFKSRFKEFSQPQLYSILEIQSRKNLLVSAPTGSTKTLTAFLSILNTLVDSAEKGILENKVYAVYVSPLKALNYDIEVNLVEPLREIEEVAGKKLGIRVSVRTGDTPQKEKTKMVKRPPHILITTPESLAISLSSIKLRDCLRSVEWVVVDEIHALAENKRGVQLSLLLEVLQEMSPAMARIGLSATVAPIDEIAKFLVGYKDGSERDCMIVDVQFIKKLDLKVICPVKNLIDTSYIKKQSALYHLINSLIQEHRTTLIFTNTRAATERVVDQLKERFPKNYSENIGAHHGSLSAEHRRNIEQRLRNGRLKVVVSSTSLELGIDIGYIDLVILLGSPKSVARALQRTGRSGHRLHDITKGRIIAMDRDDLVECAVLLKNAIERKVDRIGIPQNALDVLAQQIFGISLQGPIDLNSVFALVRRSYCYHNLSRNDFNDVIDYLSGKFYLEQRHVYAKIWHDEETGMIGKKGKNARMIYMTNVSTIPDESFVTVKVGTQIIGKIDESFLGRLRRGDVFVLGGEKYEFLYSRGTVVQVNASVYRPPTIPQWTSEMLPLSFDLAQEISKFRRLIDEKISAGKSKHEIMKFIYDYLYVDTNAAESIYHYCKEQFHYALIPHDKRLVVEHYNDGKKNYYIFHALNGRRVNDALSRSFAYIAGRLHNRDVEIGVSDNGFYLASESPVKVKDILKVVGKSEMDEILKLAIERTEVLSRRFRHCATRALMILKRYMGKKKSVGRQQVGSMLLLNSVRQRSDKFPILKEARREVLEDLMDKTNALSVLRRLLNGEIEVKYIETQIPSPFAFNLVLQGQMDILKIEDRAEFLKRMHAMVIAKIATKKDNKANDFMQEAFSYVKYWDEEHTLWGSE